jgi:hypothetical protein
LAPVGTLNQGYPLLQHKGIAPMRRLLVAWRTAPNSTGWAGQRAPRGEERHHASVRPDLHRGSPGPYIHTGLEPPGRSEPRQGSEPRRTLGYAGPVLTRVQALLSAPRSGEGPLLVAHDISHRAEPDVRPCSPCIY